MFGDAKDQSTLVEQELVDSLAWFIDIRWLAGLGVLVATWFATVVLRLSLPAPVLYVIGFGVLGYNALVKLALRRVQSAPSALRRVPTYLAHAQIGLDYASMAALIHFTGGLTSPAILYFLFHIVISAILLPPVAAYLYTVLAILLVGGTAGLEFAGLLPHVPIAEYIGVELYRAPTFLLGMFFFFASTALVIAYLAITLSSRLRHHTGRIVDLGVHLQKAYSRLQTLYEGTQAVNSTLEMSQVLERLTRGTADAMGVRACSIRLLDETKGRLRVAATYGLSAAYVDKGDLVLEHNPLAREVLAGARIAIGDVMLDTRLQYPAAASTEGIRSMLSAPLLGKQGPLGLIRAYSSEVNHFTAADDAFLAAIASYGSIAIENAGAYQAFRKLDRDKSKFVLTVTHELRSPVGVVRSLLRTLLGGYAGTLTPAQEDIVTRALRRADFLQTLIDDLLDLAAGKSEIHDQGLGPILLGAAVECVLQRFQAPAREKQITLHWHCEGEEQPGVIWATKDGVDRILNNLLSNAIKYTPPGGQVITTLRRANERLQVSVADTGIGIPPGSLSHLFEEFYRAPNARSLEKEGTGLGLAIARDLIRRFDGRITVSSQPGEGTTFVVDFPMSRSSSARE